MSHEGFSARDVRATRRGEHGERVMYQDGTLTMLGRTIPVISPEQLRERLAMVGCNDATIEAIVTNLFGVAVATETPVPLGELVESLV